MNIECSILLFDFVLKAVGLWRRPRTEAVCVEGSLGQGPELYYYIYIFPGVTMFAEMRSEQSEHINFSML